MTQWKVLVVDDEEEFASALAERLNLRGFLASTVNDGEAALEIIAKDPPQVVVLDIMMPGLGGREVLQRMKQEHPRIPVILLTGRGAEQEGMEDVPPGAFDCLMKPIKIEELIDKIRAAVEQEAPQMTGKAR